MRVFLDANILFSAAKTAGAVRELMHWLQASGHDCVVTEYVIVEARRNLVREDPEAVAALDQLLASCHHSLAPAVRPDIADDALDWLPEKDRPVLAAAIYLRCDVLLTGDRTHFGSHYGTTVAGVMIHSPRSLAEALFQ